MLAGTFAPVITLVGKTWSLHLEKVTKVSREENLAMIEESIRYLVEKGKRVFYDAEHFFDAWRDDPDYSLECLRAAVAGGAENLSLCDTNGSSLPNQVAEATRAVRAAAGAGAENLSLCDTNGSSLPGQVASATREVKAAFGDSIELGCHVHNDAECGVANSLAAVDEGVRLVQGTMNGYGERCGNANLVSILPALQLKMGYDVVSPEQLAQLSTTSHFLAELLNVPLDPDQAYVGRNAFAHKGGMHVAGIAADSRTFEHLEPGLVGNQTAVLPSELSGKATILQRAESIGLDMDDAAAREAIDELKVREHEGYHYEAAEASFDLLLRKLTGDYEPLFKLEGFKVTTEMREDGKVETEATLKIVVQGERHLTVAEGNGPVNALDSALRKAITVYYPHLADVELTGYRVRILDSDHGTGAGTRVLLDSTDGEESWGSIGVSENIIEASWEALVDSLEYALPRAGGGETSS